MPIPRQGVSKDDRAAQSRSLTQDPSIGFDQSLLQRLIFQLDKFLGIAADQGQPCQSREGLRVQVSSVRHSCHGALFIRRDEGDRVRFLQVLYAVIGLHLDPIVPLRTGPKYRKVGERPKSLVQHSGHFRRVVLVGYSDRHLFGLSSGSGDQE